MLFSPLLWALIAASAFATSVLSGIVGMAGGMVLMFILISLLPVSSAMILHAATQLTANGSRAFMLRVHILWGLLPLYLLGSATAISIATYLVLVPDPAWVLLLIGLFAWSGQWSKSLQGLNITKPLTTVVCGFLVTFAQLIAGAAGPLLDLFYLNSGLGRQSVVANKALTQTHWTHAAHRLLRFVDSRTERAGLVDFPLGHRGRHRRDTHRCAHFSALARCRFSRHQPQNHSHHSHHMHHSRHLFTATRRLGARS